MLFQTPAFLVLFLIALLCVAMTRRARRQHYSLLLASYVFYGFWDVRFLLLLSLSSLLDYTAALGIRGVRLRLASQVRASLAWLAAAFVLLGWTGLGAPLAVCALLSVLGPVLYAGYFRLGETSRRRAFLVTSALVNLGILGFFKYFDFFRGNLLGLSQLVVPGVDLGAALPELDVILPVGISFYTFQTMSYTIEVYRGRIEPERDPLRVALFAAYFPQLVAGPILRPGDFLPRLQTAWQVRAEPLRSGFHLVLVGLAKKILVADHIAPLASAILDDPVGRPSLMIMFGAALFAVQIYCDFSGYTDIARGLSRMLGIEIPKNFNFPYFSRSLTDFWRRWHISLSTWLRDYVYIPLGGSRHGLGRTCGCILATMALGGLWHGAGWNFVIWGGYHGVLLCLERVLSGWLSRSPGLSRVAEHRGFRLLRWAVTLYLTLLGWLIFRVADLDSLWAAARSFAVFDGRLEMAAWGLGRAAPFTAALAFALFVVAHAIGYRWRRWPEMLDAASPVARTCLYFLAGMALFFGWPDADVPFLYFQF